MNGMLFGLPELLILLLFIFELLGAVLFAKRKRLLKGLIGGFSCGLLLNVAVIQLLRRAILPAVVLLAVVVAAMMLPLLVFVLFYRKRERAKPVERRDEDEKQKAV